MTDAKKYKSDIMAREQLMIDGMRLAETESKNQHVSNLHSYAGLSESSLNRKIRNDNKVTEEAMRSRY